MDYGMKDILVHDLIIHGINLNDLKPGTTRDERTPESCLLADTESWMLRSRVSLEDMKEGTFYDVLENDGRDVDGRKVTKEEARRIIDKYNNYNRNRYFDVDEKKMRKVRKPLNLETLDELRKAYGLPPDWEKNIPKKDDMEKKEKEKKEKEKAKKEKEKALNDLVDELLQDLGLPPRPEVDEVERPPPRRGWLLDEGYRKMFKYMKPDPNEDPYEEDEEEEQQKKKEEEEKNKKKYKKKIVSHPIPDVPIKYEGSWGSILTKHLNPNLDLEMI